MSELVIPIGYDQSTKKFYTLKDSVLDEFSDDIDCVTNKKITNEELNSVIRTVEYLTLLYFIPEKGKYDKTKYKYVIDKESIQHVFQDFNKVVDKSYAIINSDNKDIESNNNLVVLNFRRKKHKLKKIDMETN